MLGVLVALGLSWLLLWLVSKEHITALGLRPTAPRLREFAIGASVMAIFCVVNLLGQAYFTQTHYTVDPNYGLARGLEATWWTFKAALFEELIFRGALLFLLIKRFGINRACIVSAIAFGIYHWFSYGLWGGRIIPMIFVFLLTGASGYMFALAFAKTRSLYASFGLHFGWIVVSIVVFSAGPLGSQLLVPGGDIVELNEWANLGFFVWQTLIVPGVVIGYLRKRYPTPPSEPSAPESP